MSNWSKTYPISCNRDCGAGCPLLAHVEDGTIKKITMNPLAPKSMEGCARGFNAHKTVYAKDRITKPLLRSGSRGEDRFVEIPWEEALDRTADMLETTRRRRGNDHITVLGGSGSCRGALHHTGKLPDRFFRLFGGYTRCEGSYSTQAISFVQPFLFGREPVGLDAATLLDSSLIILWGANISVNRFGCMWEYYIREAQKQGVRVVAIDPRKSETVQKLGCEWIPVLPGTDAALMCAVLWVLLGESLIDRAFIERYSIGFGELEAYIDGKVDGTPKTPQWAERICGTPKEVIRAFAYAYGNATSAALLPGVSFQRTLGGEEACRLAVALQVATGNVGKKGGSSGGNIWNALEKPRCGTIELAGSTNPYPTVPKYRWPDAILGGKDAGFPADISMIYNVGGNYINQGSDIKKNIEAFTNIEFAVCHDLFLTPTATYCDIVFPVTHWLERDDIVFPGINFLFYSHKVVDPPPEVRDDWDIFCALSKRLGFYDAFTENRSKEQWLIHFLDHSEIDDRESLYRTGIYNGGDQQRVGLQAFIENPKKHPLTTPSGKIELCSQKYALTDAPACPQARIASPSERYPLRMITPHALFRINSINWNMPWAHATETHSIRMHPDDAADRGITDGAAVMVQSENGTMVIRVQVTKSIVRGAVSVFQGAWFSLDASLVDHAGSANILTSTEPTLPSNGSRTHSVFVEVMLPGSLRNADKP